MLDKPIYYGDSGIFVLNLESEDYTERQRVIIEDQVSDQILKEYGREPFKNHENSIIGYVILPTPQELNLGMTETVVHLI